MGLRLLVALLMAAVLAAPAAWAQGEEDAKELKELIKKSGGVAEGEKKLLKEDAAAIKKKLLLEKKKKAGKPSLPAPSAAEADALAVPDVPAVEGVESDVATPAGPGAAPEPEAAEAARHEAGERRGRAMGRAAVSAESLRRSLAPAEEEAGPGGREDGAAARGGPGGGESVQELALAEKSGFAEAFRSQGLKVGAGPRGEAAIQRVDGSPATEAELGRLRAVLRSEPEALRRRPDFFQVLSRAQFSDLKRDFVARPELGPTAFKHMALSEGGRDFRWSESCSPLSGDCNPVAADQPYRKGQDVSPEDLDEVWEALEEVDEEDEDWGEYTEEDRRLAEAEDLALSKLAGGKGRLPALGALLGRLKSLARGLGEGLGLVAGSVPEPTAVAASEAALGRGGGPADVAGAEPSGGGTSATAPRSGPPPAPGGGRAAGRRSLLYVLAAAAAAGFIAVGLRKKP